MHMYLCVKIHIRVYVGAHVCQQHPCGPRMLLGHVHTHLSGEMEDRGGVRGDRHMFPFPWPSPNALETCSMSSL